MQPLRRLGSWLGVAILWLLHLLPNRAIAAVGRGLGSILYRFGRGHVTRVNLAMCFPDMPEAERHALGLAHFKALGRALAEQSVFWFAPIERAMAMVTLTGGALRPLAGATGHRVCTPLHRAEPAGRRWRTRAGLGLIYSRQKNPVLDRLLYRGRVLRPPRPFAPGRCMLAIVRTIREGRMFYFLPDMDFGPRDAIFTPFFSADGHGDGVAAAAKLARAYVAPVVTRQTRTATRWDLSAVGELLHRGRRRRTSAG